MTDMNVDVNKLPNSIKDQFNSNILEYISISTITINCKFGSDLTIDKDIYKLLNNKMFFLPKSKFNDAGEEINIMLENDKVVNIKLYTTGKMLLAGCQSFNEIETTLSLLIKNIKHYIPNKIANIDNFNLSTINNFVINLINVGFETNMSIDRFKLHTLLNDKQIKNDFDSTRYHGVKIQIDHENDKENNLICVFQTGKILMQKNKSFKEVEYCFKFIVEILTENYNKIVKLSLNDYMDEDVENIIKSK